MATTRFDSDDLEVDAFYGELSSLDLQPLWELPELPLQPHPRSVPFVWRSADFKRLGEQAGNLVKVGEGGDRRVLCCANPGLGGLPATVGTLGAAMQYLGVDEEAPPHRHTPAALRFVLEGTGVWTLVNGDPIPMEPGDLILTPSWAFHAHHNSGSAPMMWLDVLDVPLVAALDAVFYEAGEGASVDRAQPARSRSEHLVGAGAGLLPVGAELTSAHSPLLAYRWANTERALELQFSQGAEYAHVRYSDPATGRDVMPTLRCEMLRVRGGNSLPGRRQTGSRVLCVLHGEAQVGVGDSLFDIGPGDVVAVPSWHVLTVDARSDVDLFITSDAPVHTALGLYREEPIS